jgi:hypothetical protein
MMLVIIPASVTFWMRSTNREWSARGSLWDRRRFHRRFSRAENEDVGNREVTFSLGDEESLVHGSALGGWLGFISGRHGNGG